jgi:hypothetical protein
MEEWKFREKLSRFMRSWPILVFVFIGSGILAGFLVHFFPPMQWAVAELYIGIDMTRVYDVASLAAYAKTEPFNIDDYKNWQLTQASSISKSEEIAIQTLNELKDLDDYWSDVTTSEFKKMQEIDWYDVGVWRLRIRAKGGEQALQAVEIWRDNAKEELQRLITESEDVLEYEGRLRAGDEIVTMGEIRFTQLEELIQAIEEEKTKLDAMESSQVVSPAERDELWKLIAEFSNNDAVWIKLLSDMPPGGDKPSAYIQWLDEVLLLINDETDQILITKDLVEEDLESTREDYIREISEAEGLSASLIIEDHYSEPFLESTYPDSVVGIIASFAGLLVYIIVWVMVTEIKEEKNAR